MGGPNTRFDAVEYKYRLTDICLGAGGDLTVEKANVEVNETNTKVLTANIPKALIDEVSRPAQIDTLEEPIEDLFTEETAKSPNVILSIPDEDSIEEISDFSVEDNANVITPLENFGFHYVSGWLGSKDAKHLVELAKDNYVKEEFVS